MDRSDAATTLLKWQLEGRSDLVEAVSGDGDRPLVALVEPIVRSDPAPRARRRRPAPSADFLRLGEEREVARLRERMRGLLPLLCPREAEALEGRLRPNVMPSGQLVVLQADLERIGRAQVRPGAQGGVQAGGPPPPAAAKPRALRGLLLFSLEGRLLASAGDLRALDLDALSPFVARGEAGSTWRLTHRVGVLVGHVGRRAVIVACFSGRPGPHTREGLRISLERLEQRERLLNEIRQPGNHETLASFLRAVRVLLDRGA